MRYIYTMLVCCVSVFQVLYAEEEPMIRRYLHLYHSFPNAFSPQGDWEKGEIAIIDEFQKMVDVQEVTKQRLLKKGLSLQEATDRSRVGVIQEDAYWIWIRDAVRFPAGNIEIYNRFLHKKSLTSQGGSPINGVGTLAVFPDQKILLNMIFRHATRSWEIELPRGGVNPNETFEETAHREVTEETGCIIQDLHLLGTMPFDTGAMTSFNTVFFAKIINKEKPRRDEEEVIAQVLALSKAEIVEGFVKGEIEITVNGESIKAHCRDPLLSYAILVAEAKDLL